jgi:hypothetical protein
LIQPIVFDLNYNDNYSFSLTEEEGWVVAAIEIENIDKF